MKIENFHLKKIDSFLIFAQNIDCGYTLEPPRDEAVLTSTHNLCFGAKISKQEYPCIPQFYYIKVGYKGVFIAWACFPDGKSKRKSMRGREAVGFGHVWVRTRKVNP